MSFSETFLISPLSVPNCQLWLDAADSTTMSLSGSNVTQWRDKSGNGRNATGTGPPTLIQSMQNKLPAIYFNGSSYFTGSLTNTTAQHSFFSVFRFNTGAPQYARLASFGQNGQFDYNNNAYYNASYNTGTLAITRSPTETQVTLASPALDAFHQASVIFTGQTGLYYTDGGTNSNSAAWSASFNFNQYRLGSDQIPFVPQELLGYIAEVIVYSSGVTASDRQKIEGYLAWKWGLQSNLPTTHPYRYSRPLDSIPLPQSLLVPSRPLRNVFVFNPTVISNCALWLDAADSSTLSLSGTSVTQWRDKSGNGRNATPYASSPIYSNSNIVFTGSQMLNTSLSSVLNQQTVFAIASASSVNKMDIVGVQTSAINTGIQMIIQNYNQVVTLFGGTLVANGSAVTPNTRFMFANIYNAGNNSFIYLNGSQTGTKSASTTLSGSGTITIGAYYYVGNDPTPNEWWIGNINEIIIYNVVLSISDRQKVEGYLAWKWGLEANLPITHPFRTNPPDLPAAAPRGITQVKSAFFSPRNIPGIQLWLDAADVSTITAGATITGWTDKSGLSKTVTFSGTNNTYDATTKSVNTDNATVNYFYANVNLKRSQVKYANVFIVYTWIGSGVSAAQALWGQDNGGGWNRFQLLSFPATPSIAFGLSHTPVSPNVTVVSNMNTSNRLLYCATYKYLDTNASYVTINGSLSSAYVTEAAASPETTTTNTYFATIDTGWSGKVAFHEIIISTSNLTVLQRQTTEGYLAWKWGMQGNLPSTHPFKLFPPSP